MSRYFYRRAHPKLQIVDCTEYGQLILDIIVDDGEVTDIAQADPLKQLMTLEECDDLHEHVVALIIDHTDLGNKMLPDNEKYYYAEYPPFRGSPRHYDEADLNNLDMERIKRGDILASHTQLASFVKFVKTTETKRNNSSIYAGILGFFC